MLERFKREEPVDHDKMKEESLKAIYQGKALPTPEFAAEQGEEMTQLLMSEMEGLNAEQLDSLRTNIEAVSSKNMEEAREALEKMADFSSLRPRGIVPQVIAGFILGNLVSPGAGGAVGAGAMAVKAGVERYTAGGDLEAARQRAEFIRDLIAKVGTEKARADDNLENERVTG